MMISSGVTVSHASSGVHITYEEGNHQQHHFSVVVLRSNGDWLYRLLRQSRKCEGKLPI